MNSIYKLTDAAKLLGIGRRQMWRWVKQGKVPTVQTPSGRLGVPTEWLKQATGEVPKESGRCAIYSRESSSENKAALASQTDGLRRFATARGWSIVRVVEEYGSGVNDSRKKLSSLLNRGDFDILLIEHKDRLTRFGYRWFETICPFKIEVVNRSEDDTHDLMEDLVAILTSFSARLYGQTRGRKATKAAIAALESST